LFYYYIVYREIWNFWNLEIWFSTRSFGLRRCAHALKIFERALALILKKEKQTKISERKKGMLRGKLNN